jgi:hypothetical protein
MRNITVGNSTKTTLAAVLLSGGLSGCNLIFGIEGGELTGGAGGSTTSTSTNQGGGGNGQGGATTTTSTGGGTTSAGGGGSGGGAPQICVPEDLADGETIGASCGVFVDAGKTGVGTKADPIGALKSAIEAAQTQQLDNIYVCGTSTYSPSDKSLSVPAGFHVYGALDCADWHYDPNQRPTIRGYADFPTVIIGSTGSVLLADLRIDAVPAVTVGESSVALFIAKADVELRRVEVTAGGGAPGADGQPYLQPGPSGNAGAVGDGCGTNLGHGGLGGTSMCPFPAGATVDGGKGGDGSDGSTSASPGVTGQGNSGTSGSGGTGAGATNGCFSGVQGVTGFEGGAGPISSGVGQFGSNGYIAVPAQLAMPGGNGGGGGGGGGAFASTCLRNHGGGGGGGGGCGGAGGRGGQGGGASLPIMVGSGSLTVIGGAITAGVGGRGGNGEKGQPGGMGGMPGPGQPNNPGGGASCPGGPGGSGGEGGPGSGGAGGPAACYATSGTATVTLDTGAMPSLSCGGGGTRGSGATSSSGMMAANGDPGVSCTHLNLTDGTCSTN